MTNTYHLIHGEQPEPIKVTRAGKANGTRRSAFTVEVRGETVDCQAAWSDGHLRLVVDGRVYACEVERDGDLVQVHLNGHVVDLGLINDREYRRRQRSGGSLADESPTIASPMAGRVVTVRAKPGDSVVEGQGLLIIEAMKMENEIKASRVGTIAEVFVQDGDTVEVAASLLRFADEPATESAPEGA